MNLEKLMQNKEKLTPEQKQLLRDEAKENLALRDAMSRLLKNPDFKAVFTENYVKNEPSRIASILASAQFCNDTVEKKTLHREICNEQLLAVSYFTQYIREIYGFADMAQKTIEALDSNVEINDDTGE